MDKSFIVFIAIGMGFLYFITNFVSDIQAEDDKYANEAYTKKHLYDSYKTVDSVGREILDLTDATENIQYDAWNNSKLKEDFLSLFPNFSDMKIFINERIRGEIKDKILLNIDKVEDKYFSGTINIEQSKRILSNLK